LRGNTTGGDSPQATRVVKSTGGTSREQGEVFAEIEPRLQIGDGLLAGRTSSGAAGAAARRQGCPRRGECGRCTVVRRASRARTRRGPGRRGAVR
jgi:hypothetical protein